MDTRLLPLYREVTAALRKAAVFEKHAAADPSDEKLAWKTEQARNLFDHIKEASALTDLATRAMAHPVGRGAMYAAGAAIPATAAGAYLIHRGGEEARETASDLRNKALQTALGVGGIGAGLMGVHRLLQPSTKTGSADDEILLEKFATTGFLDTLLEDQEKNGTDENVRRDARECRFLNAEHGVDILRQLLA
jgi:hypothetical protein